MKDHTTLLAWQEAEVVSLAVKGLNRRYWKPASADLFGQLSRASLSVQLNITEGYAFTATPSFIRHLQIAYASAMETGDAPKLLEKDGTVPAEVITPILDRCRRCQRLTLGLIHRVRRQLGRPDVETP